MKAVSLFTGAGGLDSGFHSYGNYEFLLANEILENPVATYNKNFNNSTLASSSSGLDLKYFQTSSQKILYHESRLFPDHS